MRPPPALSLAAALLALIPCALSPAAVDASPRVYEVREIRADAASPFVPFEAAMLEMISAPATVEGTRVRMALELDGDTLTRAAWHQTFLIDAEGDGGGRVARSCSVTMPIHRDLTADRLHLPARLATSAHVAILSGDQPTPTPLRCGVELPAGDYTLSRPAPDTLQLTHTGGLAFRLTATTAPLSVDTEAEVDALRKRLSP